ncbi:TAP-like protein [Haloechinothrix alba]|uniref:TAP-like protein n=1 Tax=Haloechinothrix alba TaxID=664784 RepID=A0A238UY70_9PSEU|nr:alpha/beta hydrolase [Haloechinothrix alba]SNR27262.1 TAP-like protein [Haloechinothrix alba]
MPRRSPAVLISLGSVGALLSATVPAVATPAVPDTGQPPVPQRYTAQALDWRPCSEEDLPDARQEARELLECAEYTAPQDWTAPAEGDDVTIAVSRLPSPGGDADRSLLTNPGGPGGPGRAFPAHFADRDTLRAEYNVVGFDPRGTGMSTNITCNGATADLDPLDPRDRSPANIDRILRATEDAAEACQRHSGELGPLVNTRQTVRDIDLLRELLDRDRISWIGYSAGTWLGAHYTEAFPERADRFVLDSSVEFTADWQESFRRQPRGFERRWRQDFLPWIAEHHDVYGYGRSAEEARAIYERVRAQLEDEPVEIDGTTVGPARFDERIIGSMYGKSAFPGLAEFLTATRTLTGEQAGPGERAEARRTLASVRIPNPPRGPRPLTVHPETSPDGDNAANPGEYDDAATASFWSIPCNETDWKGDRDSVRQESARLGEQYPLLGWGWLSQPCIFWDGEPVDLPTPTGEGVPPVLMVQSTTDPATPIEGARRAHRAFEGSAMLTVVDEGDHGLYASGNRCVDRTVEDYLVHDATPQDSVCKGTPLPEPRAAR